MYTNVSQVNLSEFTKKAVHESDSDKFTSRDLSSPFVVFDDNATDRNEEEVIMLRNRCVHISGLVIVSLLRFECVENYELIYIITCIL